MSKPKASPVFFVAALAAISFAGQLAFARRTRESARRSARRRIVQAIDAERRRIRRDLHDTAQQRIVSTRLRLGALAADAHLDQAAMTTLADELDATLAEIRAVTGSDGTDLPLRNGVSAALRTAAARAPLPVLVDSSGLGRLAADVERQIYLSCLEALQNVFKHSGARHARIHLRRRAGRVGFEIADDGRGFDPSRVSGGQGLRNIAYRLESLGGTMSITANPGQGTRVHGEVPIPEASAPRRRRLLLSVRRQARHAIRWLPEASLAVPARLAMPGSRRRTRRATSPAETP